VTRKLPATTPPPPPLLLLLLLLLHGLPLLCSELWTCVMLCIVYCVACAACLSCLSRLFCPDYTRPSAAGATAALAQHPEECTSMVAPPLTCIIIQHLTSYITISHAAAPLPSPFSLRTLAWASAAVPISTVAHTKTLSPCL